MPTNNEPVAAKSMASGSARATAPILLAFVLGAVVGGGVVWKLRGSATLGTADGAQHADSALPSSGTTAGAAEGTAAMTEYASLSGTVSAVTSTGFTMEVAVSKSGSGPETREVTVGKTTVISTSIFGGGATSKSDKGTASDDAKILSLADLKDGMQVMVVLLAADEGKASFTPTEVRITSSLNAAGTLPPPPAPTGAPLNPAPTTTTGEPIKPPQPPAAGTGAVSQPPKK